MCEVSEPRRHFVDVVGRQSLFSFQNKHTPTQTHIHTLSHTPKARNESDCMSDSQPISLAYFSLSLSLSLSLLDATIKIATYSNDSCSHCSFIFTFTTIPIESPSLSPEEYPHSLGQSSVLSHFRLCETMRVSSIVYAPCIN